MSENYSVLILAGGNSSRMQAPKPWLPFEKNTFLEHIIDVYSECGLKNITVVLNEAFAGGIWEKKVESIKRNAIIVKNNKVEKGRLYSIKLGLNNMKKTKYVYIHNVDNPFISESVIELLSLNASSVGVCIPSYRGRKGHPVLISDKIIEAVLKNNNYNITLRDILNGFPQKKVIVNTDSILYNINTPSDLKMSMSEYL